MEECNRDSVQRLPYQRKIFRSEEWFVEYVSIKDGGAVSTQNEKSVFTPKPKLVS
jgi:hypothetical protein